mgnify:CR=1 FL=1
MNQATTMDEGLTLDELQRNPFDASAEQIQSNPEDDRKLLVRFYMHPVQQTAKSIKAGRKIFKDTEYIEILIPGDKHSIIRRQASNLDRNRFAEAYKRFKMGLANQTEGTPLSNLIWMTEAKIKEYEYFNIVTVEQLAEAADGSGAGAIMGFVDDKRKAEAFLDSTKNEAPLVAMRAKLDERDAELETLKRQMQELSSKLEKQPTSARGQKAG